MELGIVIDNASQAAAPSGVATPANSETAAPRAPVLAANAIAPRNKPALVGGAGDGAPQRPPPPQGSGRGRVVDILV